MKHAKYKISIITLVLAFVMSLTAFFAIHAVPAFAEGTVTVSGSNVFIATGQANVIAYRQGEGDGAEDYTMFVLAYGDDGVSYRRNLAYNWMEKTEDGVVNGLFNMEIGLVSTAFEKYAIKFESQEYNLSKEGKATNYVAFFPAEQSGKVYAVITDNAEATVDEADTDIVLDAANITVKFTEKLAGGYAVCVSDAAGNAVEGVFNNVGGNYAKAVTSGTTLVYPLSFSAEFADENADNRETAKMVLYSLNGQSFLLTGATYDENNSYYYGGTVTDDTAPVLCLDNDINYFTLGGEIDIDYAVIDVLRTSPKATVNYYVLTYDQYQDDEIDYNDTELFSELSSTDDYLLISDKDKFLPDTSASEVYGDKLTADMVLKVYLTLTDTTNNGESVDVYLDWYVADEYKINVKGTDFIAVAKDELGVTYNYDGVDGQSWQEIIDEYQAKIDELAADLSAGSSTYLYLPSAEKLFSDNATSYTDMTFGIYYYHNTQSSNTGLASSNLSINVTQQGAYTFTIYATDAAGNNMYYLDEDGEIVEFAASEIWKMYADEDEEGLTEKLPWFTFDAAYTGVSFDEIPGAQATAYVGTSYTSASFSINGISGSYTTVYRLFLFDRSAYYADKNENLTYDEFIAVMEDLFNDPATRKYFTEIPALSELEETDPDYEKYSAYAWSGTSTTFTPQDNNAFYMIRAEVTDTQYVSDPVTCSLGIVASVKANTIKGESDWLKNNVTSVVLLAVAGVALIGIILLIAIRPKDKGDIDAQFVEAKEKDKKSK